MNERGVVEIGQTLHGYAGGHRLLAASRSYARDVERLLLVLSDVSGPGAVEGFDGYLTGYPLPGGAGFAVARTWLAPEMPRPGCVWTHTLIIPVVDIDQVVDTGTFLGHFRRPRSSHALDDYQAAVRLPVGGDDPTPLAAPREHEARAIVHAVYGSPRQPVVLTADRAEQFEALVIRLWRGQWSSLRKSFSFCTGSFANRELDGQAFDLQVMPWTEVRRLAKSSPAPVVVSPERLAAGVSEPWVVVAAGDVVGNDGPPVRPLLRAIGRSLPGDRSYYKPLTRISCLDITRPSRELASDIVSVIAEAFPAPTAGLPLKRLAVQPEGLELTPGHSIDAFELVGAVVLADTPQAFADLGAEIGTSAERLWSENSWRLDHAVCDVVSRPADPTRDAFLGGVVRAVQPGELSRLSDRCPGALAAILTRSPRLALSPDVWRGSSAHHERVIEFVRREADKYVSDAADMVRAALDAAIAPADRLADVFGETAVFAFLDWHASRHPNPLPGGWREVIASDVTQPVRWLERRDTVPPESLVLLTGILDPRNTEVRSGGTATWTKHAASVREVPESARCRVLSFYLMLGLQDSADATFLPVSVAFTDYYRAARDGRLPDSDWDAVSALLPAGDWWWAWDRCARLRLGVAERFVAGCWSPSRLFELTPDEGVFSDFFDTLRSFKSGRRFIRRIAEGAKRGQYGGHHWQQLFFDGW